MQTYRKLANSGLGAVSFRRMNKAMNRLAQATRMREHQRTGIARLPLPHKVEVDFGQGFIDISEHVDNIEIKYDPPVDLKAGELFTPFTLGRRGLMSFELNYVPMVREVTVNGRVVEVTKDGALVEFDEPITLPDGTVMKSCLIERPEES